MVRLICTCLGQPPCCDGCDRECPPVTGGRPAAPGSKRDLGRCWPGAWRYTPPVTTTRLTRHIRAPRGVVYRALLDAQDVQQWMVPDSMTSQVHSFDAREGGEFRISLTYEMPTAAGKTTAQTDSFHAQFVKLVPDTEVVQVVEFETDDPAMRGEMTITYALADADDGTELVLLYENLPPGVSPTDNELGSRMSLGKLAKLVEGR
jgi:uncharacterized protein YndB with AHSA1/START domain